MKKLLFIIFNLVLILSFAAIPAMAKKAGEIKDGIYTDDTYGFSFKVPAGWSDKISSAKKPDRIVLNQKSYPVPQEFQGDNIDFAQVPTMIFLADTTSHVVDTFFEKFMDPEFKSKQKDYFYKKLRLISKPHEVLEKGEITIEKSKSLYIRARQQYTIEIPQRGSDRADIVSDFKSGAVFFTVRDNYVLVIQIIYEHQYDAQYKDLFFSTLLKSLKFND